MDAKMLIESIDYLFKADVPAFIWGHHGIGKSSIPKQWCENKDWLLFDFRLNTQADVGDFLGLMDFVKDENGDIYATKHFTPQWLVDSIKYCEDNPDKGALIFLDELNRAARFDMVGPVFQMSLDKRLHTVKFPPNLKILVASNPNTEDYNVLNLDDKALLDRFLHIKFSPTRKEFFEYMVDKEVDDTIIEFLREHPQFIEQDSKELEDFSISDIATPSRRTWAEYTNKLMKIGTPKYLMKEFMKGLVGNTIATAFVKFQDNDLRPLKAVQVLDNYKKYRGKVVKMMKDTEGSRTDVFKASVENLIDYIKRAETPINTTQGENLIDFLMDGPTDYVAAVMRKIYTMPNTMKFFEKNTHKRKELIKVIKLARGKAQ